MSADVDGWRSPWSSCGNSLRSTAISSPSETVVVSFFPYQRWRRELDTHDDDDYTRTHTAQRCSSQCKQLKKTTTNEEVFHVDSGAREQ